MMTTEMMDYDQTAQYLGLPKGTLYAMVSRRQIPYMRLGPRLVRFSRVALDEWLRARTVVPRTTSSDDDNDNGGAGAPRTLH